MAFFQRFQLFSLRKDGRFDVKLPLESRLALAALAEQLDDAVDTNAPEVRRLFPTAYAKDPEKDAGYQVFARDQLINERHEAVAMIRETAEKDVLTEDELATWMRILNDLRLVLGTKLDVSEDDEDLDPSTPEGREHLLYHELGEILHYMVMALTNALPEIEDEEEGH